MAGTGPPARKMPPPPRSPIYGNKGSVPQTFGRKTKNCVSGQLQKPLLSLSTMYPRTYPRNLRCCRENHPSPAGWSDDKFTRTKARHESDKEGGKVGRTVQSSVRAKIDTELPFAREIWVT